MFSIYQQTRAQVSVIELYVEFEKLVEVDLPEPNIDWTVYNTESEEEFGGTYHIVGPAEDVDECDIIVEPEVVDMTNALTRQHPSREPSFMHVLDLAAVKDQNFLNPVVLTDGEFVIGREFSSRETVIAAIKDYTICRGVDYRAVYNSSHTYTRTIICQDHAKLNSDMIAEVIKPFVEVDPSLKVKFVIVEVQSKFNYTTSYCKAWLVKQKAIANIFGGWEASYEALPSWFEAMVQKNSSAAV
ncbi:hypothetical protein Ahy_B09g099684 [Arachis hypogaea]|uniref:Transposase MuDR plant domain-containing protein n=1 Tax=Arachis hypogaea TaxID=3818 RepID=A0A444XVI2_ARAHY|nr:hypothetical protein Ahy_B09g099684 [Arachis hypogaea]